MNGKKGKPSSKLPTGVFLIGWRGDVSQLAAQLRIDEGLLEERLRRMTTDRLGQRLLVNVLIRNQQAVLDALKRRLAEASEDW